MIAQTTGKNWHQYNEEGYGENKTLSTSQQTRDDNTGEIYPYGKKPT